MIAGGNYWVRNVYSHDIAERFDNSTDFGKISTGRIWIVNFQQGVRDGSSPTKRRNFALVRDQEMPKGAREKERDLIKQNISFGEE